MEPIRKISIIGCGQIGSRHLQAVVKLKGNLKIQVVDPNKESQKMGKERLGEALKALPKNHNIKIEWLDNITSLNNDSNLTIVATTAKGRSEIINQLVQKGHRRFLIEKIVCQSTEEFEKLLILFDKNKAKGWINCTRRYYPFYKRIINLLKKEAPIFFSVIAGNLGLGCNVIHFIDLFYALTQNPTDIKLSGDYLFPEILPNPRGNDLIEFAGTIIAETKRYDVCSISFFPYNDTLPLVIILTKNIRVFIDEGIHKAVIAKKEHDWQWQNFKFKELYTSILTTHIAQSIIENDVCNLPTIQDSYYIHRELLRIFNKHIELVSGKYTSNCPIT